MSESEPEPAMPFWEQVRACQHQWAPDYYERAGGCTCGNARESHCLKCGVFEVNDPCGEQHGMSGWSYRRRRAA